MRVSAKVDCALRAMLELAADGGLVKGEQLASAQGIPRKFLETILLELRHDELDMSQRGVDGGYALARPATEITVADVIRAVEGPIATVRGARPEDVAYGESRERCNRCGSSSAAQCATSSRGRRSPSWWRSATRAREGETYLALREEPLAPGAHPDDLALLQLELLEPLAGQLDR